MLAKILQKVTNPSSSNLKAKFAQDLDMHIALHYGIPWTASVLAFDPIQRLMAIGTLDGRIKVIGGDNIEGLFMSPKQLPYKSLEFLHNKGFLVSISNANEIQVWDLEHRCMDCCLQWDSNITAFSVIQGTCFMYLGDEYGLISVVKYSAEERKLLQLPYHIPASSLAEAAGVPVTSYQSIVGVLTEPLASENRLLIAYENGLIILWDVSEARVLQVRGSKKLQLGDRIVVDSSNVVRNEITDDTSDPGIEDKEISSLCWASSSESILAVGYVDGDIMLWNMSSASSTKDQQAGESSTDVVKLQLSSGEKRLPVIVLQWSANGRSHNDNSGRLFIYGGDEIGSEEVLTVLSLEWSSGIKTLQCIGRVDLTLHGSFADMVIIPNDGKTGNNPDNTLFVLANPGQLHVYDDAILSALSSKEKKASVSAMQFPMAIPTVNPDLTVTKLTLVPKGENSSKVLLKYVASAASTSTVSTKWPLTGGVPSQLNLPKDNGVERVYMAGYQDGSVRVWDATHPTLSLIFVLEGEVQNVKVAGASTSVSALDFCSLTMSLAVGNECGLVRVYKLSGSSDEVSFHFVTETKHEVHAMRREKGLQCIAVISVRNSPIRTLNYTSSGAKLAVGFECGLVGVVDMSSLSVLFLTDSLSDSSSPFISMTWKAYVDVQNAINSQNRQESRSVEDTRDVLLILTRDSHVVAMDSVTGNRIGSRLVRRKKESIAISMHIVESSVSDSEFSNEKHPEQLSEDNKTQNEPTLTNRLGEVELQTSTETTISGERGSDSLILLCSEDALHLFSLESVLKEDDSSIRKINLGESCCWATTFNKKDEKACGLILLYQTGVIEIRALPDLEVVEENSLMSILRWSFKKNMDKTICSSDNGQIFLVNGCELAFISILASENDYRIPESLPCLHDKVLAAAADTAAASNQKKKQGTTPKILGGIIKGLKGEKERTTRDVANHLTNSNAIPQLENIFSSDPFSAPSETITDDQKVMELNIDDIVIDDIVIDGPIHVGPILSQQGKNNKKDKKTEREKLFEGGSADTKPVQRTAEEIKAKYRKTDASAAASQAKDKLIERQEKLEKLRLHTEELQNGAENFSSMAHELAKRMEAKKWWNI